MRVNIVTPVHPGGPYYAGKQLARILNKKGIRAKWTHSLAESLLSPLVPKADITHTVGVPMFARCKRWKGPLVFSLCGDYQIEKTIWQRFFPRTIEQADVVTSPSQYLKEKLGTERAIIVPHTVFPEEFNLATHTDREVLNLVTITGFAFFHKAKGVINVARALRIAQDKGARFHYKVIGGGKYLTTIKDEVRSYGLDIEFTGFLPDPKQVLEESDVFLYYSCHDNVPVVILEAMATGLPIVTCNVGAMSETIDDGHNGYVAHNEEELLNRLLMLIGNCELRQQIGHSAREKVEQKFNWHVMVDTYISIYERVLERRIL